MTDEEMLVCATEFTLIPFNPRRLPKGPMGIRELKIGFRGPNAWAIINEGSVLAHDGEWEYEPFPSARDEEFFARCRWPTAREAIAFAEQHMAKYPSGYKPED